MERNTNRFWWMALPALLALMALPQLFYFWLAPAMAAARWLVHGVGTVLTLALPLYACLLCWRYGLRRAAGAAALAGAAQAFTILVGAVLLAVNASLRTAGFALAAMTLAILGVLIPMAAATAHNAAARPAITIGTGCGGSATAAAGRWRTLHRKNSFAGSTRTLTGRCAICGPETGKRRSIC